jgi:DNA repair exonuclease SbcCD ATPase subunit
MKGMLRWQWCGGNIMSRLKKSGLILTMAIFIVSAAVSCGGGGTTTETETVAPADYESVKSDLAAAKAQLDAQQKELVEAQSLKSQYDDLQSEYDQLQQQYNARSADFDTLKAQYDALVSGGDQAYQDLVNQNAALAGQLADLQALYQALKEEHDLAAQQAAQVNEANIEAALFNAINVDRVNNGVGILLPATHVRDVAQQISEDMARLKQLIYDNQLHVPYQDVYQATGYRSVDDLVNATMTIWKSEALRYEINVLNSLAIYGTVYVVQDGGIYYITFMASNYP